MSGCHHPISFKKKEELTHKFMREGFNIQAGKSYCVYCLCERYERRFLDGSIEVVYKKYGERHYTVKEPLCA